MRPRVHQPCGQWAYERGIRLHFIQPGNPVQNAFAESFNGSFRDECLDQNWLTSLADARRIIEGWRQDHNDVRPHESGEEEKAPAKPNASWT